jgi:HTH-type transcriptional regulator / antitoxin HigA
MADRKIAEVFHPGEFLKEELEARNWSQIELAEIIDRNPNVINEIIMGKRGISPDTAKALGSAFDTSAQYWMNLESAYQLWRIKDTENGSAISKRAKLYQKAPIKEMTRRHWIETSENVDVLTRRVCQFFEINSLDEPIKLPHAARKSTQDVNTSHFSWFFRAKKLAHGVHANPFSEQSFKKGLQQLTNLFANLEDIRLIPKILSDCGVRLLIVEHLPHTKIDGVTFWLNDKSPVIVLSMRLDRIDAFWFTLAHELGHVANRDGLEKPIIFDTELVSDGTDSNEGEDKIDAEKSADSFAAEFLIHQPELENFILRIKPLYGRQKITNFANRIRVHPGIVVGQLQFRKEIPWSNFRTMLEKVKHIIIKSALTDGWGQTPMLKLTIRE